jgi:hypothetical protein
MIYSCDPVIDHQQAIEIALSYLDHQPYATDYIKDVAVIHDRGDYWACWFLKKQPSQATDEIIAVHKVSGKACSWLRV